MPTGYLTLTINDREATKREMTCFMAASELASGLPKLATVLHPIRLRKDLNYERHTPTLKILSVAESLDEEGLEPQERRFLITFETLENRPLALLNNIFTWLKSAHKREGFIKVEATYYCDACQKNYDSGQMHICLRKMMQSGYSSALQQHASEEGIDKPK